MTPAPLTTMGGLIFLLFSPMSAFLLHSHSAVLASHPVVDVIQQLQDLSATVEDEGKAESLSYEKFQHWCARSKKSLNEAIVNEKATLASLKDTISAATEEIEVFGTEIDQLQGELGKLTQEGTAAETLRQTQKSVALLEMQALAGTIEAIRDALTKLIDSQRKTDPSMLQQRIENILELTSASLSDSQRSLLQAFVTGATPPPFKAAGDYEAHVDEYDFKSEKVIEILKDLQARFEHDLIQRTAAERNSFSAYQLAKKARDNLHQAASDSKVAKESSKNVVEGQLRVDQQSEMDTQQDLEADIATLKTTTQDCETKAVEWAERSKVRTQEKEAIAAAIEILGKVTGVRTEAPSNPSQTTDHPFAFLQLGSPAVRRALDLLRKQARVSHSAAIAQLAEAVSQEGEGPFDQVINALQKIRYHLKKEQTEEDNHKNWCDKEIKNINEEIFDHLDKMNELNGKIQVASTRAQSLQSDIKEANTMVSAITEHMGEATEIRNVGKAENALAVQDAKAAQAALTKAILVLQDFYKSTGSMAKQSWELLQRSDDPVTLPSEPSTWNSDYVGVADPIDASTQPAGIITVLQGVMSDFAMMEAETLAQEQTDQNAYEEDMKNCKIEMARRGKEVQVKRQEREHLVSKQASMESEHKDRTKEQEAAVLYRRDLQPACVDGSSSYSQRKADRDAEIAALKEAETLLEDAFKKESKDALKNESN